MHGYAKVSRPNYVGTPRGHMWHIIKRGPWEHGLLAETYGCGVVYCSRSRVSRPPGAEICKRCLATEARERERRG